MLRIDILPIRDHAFFEKAVLERGLRQRLFQLACLGLECLDLVGRRLARDVACEPLLAGLEEILGPAVVEVLGDPLLAAQLGDAVLAAQAIEHDADLLLGREMAPGGTSDVSNELLSAFVLAPVPVGHRSLHWVNDEPGTLSYAIRSICPVGADGLQACEYQACDGRYREGNQSIRDHDVSPLRRQERLSRQRTIGCGDSAKVPGAWCHF
jgi:hypothetical protein